MTFDVTQLTFGQVFIYITAIFVITKGFISASKTIEKAAKWILEKLNLYHRKETDKESFQASVKQHTVDILQLNNKIDELTDTLKSYINETKLDNQTIMRTDLLNIYHEVHKKGYILECELDAFTETMSRYEKNGGDGKMHTVVQPYIEEIAKNKMFQSDIEAELYFKDVREY